jgi:hypothetical protein
LDQQLDQLKEFRHRAALIRRELTNAEFDGRLLRLRIEERAKGTGSTKTDAEKTAKADPEYLAHERRVADRVMDFDLVLAEAEVLHLSIQMQLAILKRVGL